MLTLILNNEAKQHLIEMMGVLFPKQEVKLIQTDGMVSLECTCCHKITHIHWYELLMDRMLPLVVKRTAIADWHSEYMDLLVFICKTRFNGKSHSTHPLETAYKHFVELKAKLETVPHNSDQEH